MSAYQALSQIERTVTRLHDAGCGNVYGDLGNSLELVERIARGDSFDSLKEFCKDNDFDECETGGWE